MPTKKTVLFVGGTARCGSTLFDLLLGHDPRGFSLGEVVSWYRPWRTHHFDIKCGCGVYPCPVWEVLAPTPENRLYDRIFETQDVDFIVDSSKSLTWIIDQNRRLSRRSDVRVLNLFLYKQPVSLYYSFFKRGQRDIRTVAGYYDYYASAMRARVPLVSLNYDEFIQDPPAALRRVCEWADLEYYEGKLKFWEGVHHHLWGSFGPRRQLHEAKAREIYVEPYSDEYQDLLPVVERQFEGNAKLRRTLQDLASKDLLKAKPAPAVDRRGVRRLPFYYRIRWREIRRRFFPQHYLDKEASLIREWRV